MFSLARTDLLAYGVSAVLHAVLLGVLVWRAVPVRMVPQAASARIRTVEADASDDREATEGSPQSVVVATAVAEGAGVSVEPGLEGEADAQTPGLSTFVRGRIDEQRQAVAGQSRAEQMRELEALGSELERVGSAKSIAELGEKLTSWLGAGERRHERDVVEVGRAGDFDVSTSQILDVRLETVAEQAQYVAVLIDAEGRTQSVELDSQEGAELHRLFDLIRRFPLLETVYRQTVMGLLDRMLADEAEPPRSEAPADDSADLPGPAPPQTKQQEDRQQDGGAA